MLTGPDRYIYMYLSGVRVKSKPFDQADNFNLLILSGCPGQWIGHHYWPVCTHQSHAYSGL